MTDNSEKALACYLSGLRGVNLAMIDATLADARKGGIAPERIEKAERARAECVQLFEQASGKGTHSAAFQRAMDAGQRLFDIAENLNDLLVLRPEVNRDRARQSGVRKPRNEALQVAVNKLVSRHPDLSATELWERAPGDIKDQIEFDRFRKRVTTARKVGRQ